MNLEIGDVSLVMFREAGIKIGQLVLYRNNLFKYYFIFTYESF
jgi:hypothetical protein